MIPNNFHQSGFNRTSAYMAGRPYQSQPYQNQVSYWNQSEAQGDYYVPIKRSVYGGEFAALPAELGGRIPGGRSGFSMIPSW